MHNEGCAKLLSAQSCCNRKDIRKPIWQLYEGPPPSADRFSEDALPALGPPGVSSSWHVYSRQFPSKAELTSTFQRVGSTNTSRSLKRPKLWQLPWKRLEELALVVLRRVVPAFGLKSAKGKIGKRLPPLMCYLHIHTLLYQINDYRIFRRKPWSMFWN